MDLYLPRIIKEFRPKCANVNDNLAKSEALILIEKLLADISEIVRSGLLKHLELVPSIQGLHLIREEALKVEIPLDWDEICEEINIPRNFDVWCYYFQDVLTKRVQYLATKKISEFTDLMNTQITKILNDTTKKIQTEADLRWYIWEENNSNDDHRVLTMKTKGFSPVIVKLCEDIDAAYLELLKDVSLYLYGTEYQGKDDFFDRISSQSNNKKKFVDREKLETHLKDECLNSINK